MRTRKPNRLHDYDYSKNGAYFITICTKNRMEILGNIVGDDAHIVPTIIQHSEYGEVVKKYIENISVLYDDVNVDNYVIMPNHVHLIIVLHNSQNNGTMWASSPTKQIGIPQIIRSMKTMITKKIGFPLWQRSYHDHIIRNQKDYNRIYEYIQNNPKTWANDCFHRANKKRMA